jgi:tetratricopeptide (TPR) repeat protein
MEKIGKVFISHTHSDVGIANALGNAIKGILSDLVDPVYSTNADLEGGIKPGEDWFRWIVNNVIEADVAVILLTPSSVQKPWILWEAGAVYGASMASPKDDASKAQPLERRVRPLVFKLSVDQVPSTFLGIQTVRGDDEAEIKRFFNNLINDFSPRMRHDTNKIVDAGKSLDSSSKKYIQEVQEALKNASSIPTEAAVEEWCERLDGFTSEKRFSEVKHLHDWLNLTFGRGRYDETPPEGWSKAPQPLDIRLHRRLGDAYLAAKEWDYAINEYKLALELAPRDIFFLRSLGKAYLDKGDKDDAKRIIDRIDELDKKAFTHNVECAALKGRLLRNDRKLEDAAQTYRIAFDNNPNSYYLADVYGQTLLELNRIEEARNVYRRARDILSRLSEQNIWSYATMATASIVLNDEGSSLEYLRQIAAKNPSPDEIDTIKGGLRLIQERLKIDSSSLDRWCAALQWRK